MSLNKICFLCIHNLQVRRRNWNKCISESASLRPPNRKTSTKRQEQREEWKISQLFQLRHSSFNFLSYKHHPVYLKIKFNILRHPSHSKNVHEHAEETGENNFSCRGQTIFKNIFQALIKELKLMSLFYSLHIGSFIILPLS